MKRKSLLFVLVFMLLISICPVAKAEVQTNVIKPDAVTTINALNYSKASRDYMDRNYGMVYNYLQMFVEYPIHVEKAGLYTVKMYGDVTTNAARYATINFFIDDELGQAATITQVEDYTAGEVAFRPVEFPEGDHVLKFKTVGGSGARIQKFTVEPTKAEEKTDGIFKKSFKNAYLPTTIQAEDFDRNGFKTDIPEKFNSEYRIDSSIMMYKGTEKNQLYISLCETEYTEYTFTAEYSGTYSFNLKAAGYGRVKFTFDGKEPALIKELVEGEQSVAVLNIPKGEHTVRVETVNDSIGLDWFSFKSSKEKGVSLDKLDTISDPEEKPVNPVYKELYVSESGNDNANGTKVAPFKTLERAKEEIAKINNSMTGDIIINVESGTYKLEETFVLDESHSGKNGYNVIFRGVDRNNPPLISGGEKITGWEKYSDVLYRAPMAEGVKEVRNFYVNNFPAIRAKSKYVYNVKSFYDDPATEEYDRDGFLVDSKNFLKNLTNHEDIELVFNVVWTMPRYPVTSIDEVDDRMLIRSKPETMAMKKSVTYLAPQSGSAFFMENAFELLDEPGEFYYNKSDGYIYYYPQKGEDMTTADTYVGKVEGLVNVQGANPREKVTNVTFDNLDFRYGAWDYVSEWGQVGRQACEFDSGEGKRKMVFQQFLVNYADNINIENCRFTCLGSSAIGMLDGVSNSNVVGNLICDVSGAAIVFGHWIYEEMVDDPTLDYEMSRNLRAENNVISRVCAEYTGCVAITAYYVNGIKVLNNDISKLPYSGITVGWGWGEDDFEGFGSYKISHNKLTEAMENLIDGNHIYLLGCLDNCDVSYNYASKTRTASQVYGGVYFDAASCNSRAHHNLTTQASCWLMWSALNWIENNYAYASYSDTAKMNYATGSGPQTLNVEPVTIVDSSDESTWNDEAKYIRDNAGVKDEYKHLLALAQTPDGKKVRIKTFPTAAFDAKSGDWIEAEDFLPGEDIGWHKQASAPKYNDNDYRPTEGVDLLKHVAFPTWVIESNGKGDWQKYEFEVPSDGVYYMDIAAAHGYSSDSSCNIYIDDVLVLENAPIKRAPEGWYVLNQTKLGSFNLTAGKHIMKYEFVNSAYVDAFRIHDGSIYALEEQALLDNNSLSYDEGVMVYE